MSHDGRNGASIKGLILMLILGCAHGHPLQNECDAENQKALSCQKEISEKFGSFFSHGFHVNSQAIAEFKKCFVHPLCTVSSKKLQLLSTKTALYEELALLSDCISEDRYRDAKGHCSQLIKQHCQYDIFFVCVTEQLEKFNECSSYEIAKFQELKPGFEQYCSLKTEIKSLLSSHH